MGCVWEVGNQVTGILSSSLKRIDTREREREKLAHKLKGGASKHIIVDESLCRHRRVH